MSEFPLPDLTDAATGEFWRAAARGELSLPRCERCGSFDWYPSGTCPGCGSDALAWTALSGRGELFSWSCVERAWVAPFKSHAPYVTGLVTLAEDPSVRLVTRIVDCEPSELRMQMPVHVVFRPLCFDGVDGEVMAPLFVPDA